jgi:predicted permease
MIGLVAALLPRGLVSVASSDVLRSARGSTADVKVTRTRSALVIAQVAIALVLLVGTGLLVRTVLHLSQRDLGFDRERLTWFQVNLPGRKYQDTEPQLQFERDALDRLGQIPGVTAAMASVGFPLWGGMMAGLGVKGDAPGTPRREVAYLSVSPDFIADVGARIVSGRALLPTDTLNAPRVVVINETMARMFWPQGDAIGAEVQIGPGSPNERWITVVGIMADMRAHGVAEPIRPTAFGSTWQYSWPRRHFAVRTAEMPITLAAELRAAIQAVDPAVAIGAITSAEETLTNSMARHRLVLLALAVFGGVAVILCISGLYAVIALDAQRRRREYAIRVALGARQGVVRWMVTRQALVLAGVGALMGLATAAFGTRAIQGLLHGVQPIDPITFAAAGATLLILATLAASVPASQAEKVNPVDALRED